MVEPDHDSCYNAIGLYVPYRVIRTIESGQGFGEFGGNERKIPHEYFIVKVAIGPVRVIDKVGVR